MLDFDMIKRKIEKIENFDINQVRTMGDLTYPFKMFTEIIIIYGSCNNYKHFSNIAHDMLENLIYNSIVANKSGFKDKGEVAQLATQYQLLLSFIKRTMIIKEP